MNVFAAAAYGAVTRKKKKKFGMLSKKCDVAWLQRPELYSDFQSAMYFGQST